MAIKPTKAETEHMSKVAGLGCIACYINRFFDSPAEIHHVKLYAGQKRDHMIVIHLCPVHHRHGQYDVAVHLDPAGFESVYGTEKDLLNMVEKMIGGNRVFE